MVHFNHEEKKLKAAFNLSENDEKQLVDFSKKIMNMEKTIPWTCQRIWIDENMSDNAKCFAVFMLGAYWEHEKRGGE